jgi:hypothetical protein
MREFDDIPAKVRAGEANVFDDSASPAGQPTAYPSSARSTMGAVLWPGSAGWPRRASRARQSAQHSRHHRRGDVGFAEPVRREQLKICPNRI